MPRRSHLQFAALRDIIAFHATKIPDGRQERKIAHKIHDVVMAGLAMMFFQDPSLLQFQKRMEQEREISNLKTLFRVASVPKDTCLRDVLDQVSPGQLAPVFNDFLQALQRGGELKPYRVLGRFYAASVDGFRLLQLPEAPLSRLSRPKEAL